MIYQHTSTVAPEKAASPSALALCTYSTTGGERVSMKMYEIKVEALGQNIAITQVDTSDGVDHVVVISPEQAELVCKWIMDTAKGSHRPQKQAVLRD